MKQLERSIVLKRLIRQKEAQRLAEAILLKDQLHQTFESLKPVNIIKSTIKEVITAPDVKMNVVNAALSLTTGFIAKKIFTGGSGNPLIKLAGVVLEMVVAGGVAKNADEIKSIAGNILKKIVNQSVPSEKA